MQRQRAFDSREEGLLVCHLARRLGVDVEGILEGLKHTLVPGDAGSWDWSWMPQDGQGKLLLDYDGGHFHREDRVLRDYNKTMHAVDSNANVFVVRVRVDAAVLNVSHSHVRIVVCDSFDPAALALGILDIITTDFRLLERIPQPSIFDPEVVLDEVESRVNKEYDHAFQRILRVGNDDLDWANAILNTNGALPRLGDFAAGLERLQDDFGMTKEDMLTFMSGSVAARIADPEFWNGLESLRTDWGMTTEDLVTFMCDGVACRLGDPQFWEGLIRLRNAVGLHNDIMVSIVNNCSARHLHSETFVFALSIVVLLLQEAGIINALFLVKPPYVNSEQAIVALAVFLLRFKSAYGVPGITMMVNSWRAKVYQWHRANVSLLLSLSANG